MIKKFNKFNESLNIMDSSLTSILKYLAITKKNKVAYFLFYLCDNPANNAESTDLYNDNEDINYLFADIDNANMIKFIPKNRRSEYHISQAMSLRIGRAIRKIYDKIKDNLNVSWSGKGRLFRDAASGNNSFVILTENVINIIVPNLTDDNMPNEIRWDSEVVLSDFNINPSVLKIKIKNDDKNSIYDITDLVYDNTYGDKGGFLFKCSGITNITYYYLNYDASGRSKYRIIECDTPNMRYGDVLRYARGSNNQKSLEDSQILDIEIAVKNDFSISDYDIEKFVNEYISYIKYTKSDETSVIVEVKGQEIKYWYNSDNYQSSLGKLGSSCMRGEDCQDYFDIYCENSQVSLLILKNKNNKLIGRALLWEFEDNYFMDRVYTANDSDENIFYNYAISKGYIYRDIKADMTFYKNNESLGKVEIKVVLDKSEFTHYPYLDTLCYLDKNNNILTNSRNVDWSKYLHDTDGDGLDRHFERAATYYGP